MPTFDIYITSHEAAVDTIAPQKQAIDADAIIYSTAFAVSDIVSYPFSTAGAELRQDNS
jgi:hypothetical protein